MPNKNDSSRAATVAERSLSAQPHPPQNAAPGPAVDSASHRDVADEDHGFTPESLIGKLIDGRYRVLKPLAEGGMGSVFLAEQLGLRRKVALKVLIAPEQESVERFQREAIALAEVSHPAIVEIYDFTAHSHEAGNRGILAMAFIDGMDLGDYLEQHPDKRLSSEEVVDLIIPIVSALVELHANGIIHRDMKPPNLVRFMRADGRPSVKLVDFGIARRQVDPGMTASGLVLGTPPYLPPEAFLGERATPLSDIYALGATMFELLTGAPPFIAEKQAQVIQRTLHEEVTFPDHLAGTPLAALLGEMLTKIQRHRPDAMQVLKALEAIRSTQTRTAAPAPAPAPQAADAPPAEPGASAGTVQLRVSRVHPTAPPPGPPPDSLPVTGSPRAQVARGRSMLVAALITSLAALAIVSALLIWGR